MTPPLRENSPPLSGTARAGLWLLFGLSTAVFIRLFDSGGSLSRLDLLLWGGSLGALLTAGAWIGWLGVRRSRGWAIAMLGGLWIPYVNFVLASIYARRYWHEDARAPGLIALAALALQAVASVRLLFEAQTPLV